MAPRFQQADPHEYVKVPKRAVSTSFSTNSSQKRKRFSQSKNFTNFSTNMTSGYSTPLFTSQWFNILSIKNVCIMILEDKYKIYISCVCVEW